MKCFCVHRERVPPFYGLVGHIGVPDDLRGTRRAVCQCLCDQCGLLGGTALVQKMFSRSTDDIPDGYRRRTRQELEKLYEGNFNSPNPEKRNELYNEYMKVNSFLCAPFEIEFE